MLNSRGGFDVVGEADNGADAVAVIRQLRPDVAVIDLNMPGLSGIEATRHITSASPETAVLVLTMFDDDDSVFAAIRAGARGYVLKGTGQRELAGAIEAVAHGEAVFGPMIADRSWPCSPATPQTAPSPSPSSPNENAKCSNYSPAGPATPTLPTASAPPKRRSATTSATSSPNSMCSTAPKQ